MTALQRLAAIVLVVLALGTASAAERRAAFTQLGSKAAIALEGDGAAATVDFGIRADELVQRATLRVRYTHSPALAPNVSHVRVALNDQVVGVLPVRAGRAGEALEQSIELDPRLVVGFNKLSMTLVAAPGEAAPQPDRPGLWAEVSGASELVVDVQPLAGADDLALLPEPFFDRRDTRRLTVPFVFAPQPKPAMLRASAVVASWFGRHARWRGARFPVRFDEATPGHVVAFVANDARPAFLKGLPPATGPQLRVMPNPAEPTSKLLLVMGRDADEVKLAADGLVLGGALLSGASMQVKAVDDKGPRGAWDAPGLVRLDRPMKLGELIDWPQQLEATGRPPALEPVKVDLRVPTDLAGGDGRGVPLALTVRYTPPACATDTNLDVGVNDELVQVLALRTANEAITESRTAYLPLAVVRGRARLQLGLRFTMKEEGGCRDSRPEVARATISPDSTLDFSGFSHYARLPDLQAFASLGYPFTRHPDLSQSVVVLPEAPSAADLETMLALMARFGEATGQPATRVRIAGPRDEAALADADLLVIGASPQQALLTRWAEAFPVALSSGARQLSPSVSRVSAVYDWLRYGAPPEGPRGASVSFEGTGPLAALYGFESPVSGRRSVIAVTAVVPEQMLRVVEAMEDGDRRRAIRGSAAFVLAGRVESLDVGRAYATGYVPPWGEGGTWLSGRGLLLAAGLSVLLLAGALAAWRLTRGLRHRRARGAA